MILAILILYILSVVGIGIYCRKKTSTVNDFVLGGRSVGPWFTAFAYGTSYLDRHRKRNTRLASAVAHLRQTDKSNVKAS